MSTLEPRTHLIAMAKRLQQMLINDLKAVPADKLTTCPGGCARTPLYMTAECAMVNGWIAGYLQGGGMDRGTREERQAFLASFDSLDKTLAFLEENTAKLIAAYEMLDEGTLGEVSDSPLGRPMSRFAVAEMPILHMMYHDGQLNYVQAFNGDAEIHW